MPPKTANQSAAEKSKPSPAGGKRTFTARPPRPVEERLPKLYRGLTDQVENGHFQNAIKTCKKILQLDPASLPAYQTLLFLHLQVDDYSAALALLSAPPKNVGEMQFERAYCLYRLHREKEALEGLDKIGEKGRKEEHLEAQIRYRLGEYEKAQEIYDGLLGNCDPSSSEHPDIVQNISATASHLDFLNHGYHTQLASSSSGTTSAAAAYQPTEGDLETYVPTLPIGWATGGVSSVVKKATAAAATSAAASKSASAAAKVKGQGTGQDQGRKKRRHRLPKGAVEGKNTNQDPDRWLPLRQRASYITAQSKKKGANQSMGVGMTQGSSAHAPSGGSGGGGGGGGGGSNKKKKGKK